MFNKNRQTPHANQKRKNNLTLETITTIINIYIYIYIYIYSVNYTLGFVEHKVLRYIPLNLNKLNITDVMYLSLTTVP